MLIVSSHPPLGDAQRGTQGEGKGVSWWRDEEWGLRVCEGVKEVKGVKG